MCRKEKEKKCSSVDSDSLWNNLWIFPQIRNSPVKLVKALFKSFPDSSLPRINWSTISCEWKIDPFWNGFLERFLVFQPDPSDILAIYLPLPVFSILLYNSASFSSAATIQSKVTSGLRVILSEIRKAGHLLHLVSYCLLGLSFPLKTNFQGFYNNWRISFIYLFTLQKLSALWYLPTVQVFTNGHIFHKTYDQNHKSWQHWHLPTKITGWTITKTVYEIIRYTE